MPDAGRPVARRCRGRRADLAAIGLQRDSGELLVGLEIHHDPGALILEREIDDAFDERVAGVGHGERRFAAEASAAAAARARSKSGCRSAAETTAPPPRVRPRSHRGHAPAARRGDRSSRRRHPAGRARARRGRARRTARPSPRLRVRVRQADVDRRRRESHPAPSTLHRAHPVRRAIRRHGWLKASRRRRPSHLPMLGVLAIVGARDARCGAGADGDDAHRRRGAALDRAFARGAPCVISPRPPRTTLSGASFAISSSRRKSRRRRAIELQRRGIPPDDVIRAIAAARLIARPRSAVRRRAVTLVWRAFWRALDERTGARPVTRSLASARADVAGRRPHRPPRSPGSENAASDARICASNVDDVK